MLRTSVLALLCAFGLSACSSSDDSGTAVDEPRGNPFPETAASDLQQTLDGVVSAEVAPGVSVVLERPGYAAWSGAAGVADLRNSSKMTSAERLRGGSILKVALATAVLQRVERGQLSLDETMPSLLSASVTSRIPNSDAVTLGMLLQHTSGIAEFDDAAFDALVAAAPTRVWTFDDLIDRAAGFSPQFAPGTSWGYSNTDYVLLGAVLTGVTGKPWRETVRTDVFARAGMSDTTLPEEGNPLCDGCARGYEPVDGALEDVTEVDPSMAGPAGGDAMITTTEDLAKLMDALANGALFDEPSTWDAMTDFTDAPIPEQAQVGYGLGMARFQVGDVTLIGHLGGTAGFQSFTFYEPSTGAVASGYMNRRGDFGAFVIPTLDAIGRAVTSE
jgi:D-alanyl-D-alanine carboxypeptidase